jgi:hypothetical protein
MAAKKPPKKKGPKKKGPTKTRRPAKRKKKPAQEEA